MRMLLSEKSDEQLMRLLSRGREEAFEVLFRRHFPRIFRFFYRSLGEEETAKDLAQEVLLKVYQSAESYMQKARVTTWLYTIARNRLLNYIRDTRKSRKEVDFMVGDRSAYEHSLETEHSTLSDPFEETKLREMETLIRDALTALPESLKTPFVMSQVTGLSYREIGEVLDITPGAVKLRVFRAREMISKWMASKEYETERSLPG